MAGPSGRVGRGYLVNRQTTAVLLTVTAAIATGPVTGSASANSCAEEMAAVYDKVALAESVMRDIFARVPVNPPPPIGIDSSIISYTTSLNPYLDMVCEATPCPGGNITVGGHSIPGVEVPTTVTAGGYAVRVC